MKYHVADHAMKGVDLSDPSTMEGIGISLGSLAPLILDAAAVVEAADKARERGQTITPTRVRFTIARLRGELARWSDLLEPEEGTE